MPTEDHSRSQEKNIVASSPSVLDHIPSAIYIKDLEGRYLYVNFEYESLLRTSKEVLYGKKDIDVLPDNIAALSRSFDMKVMSEESSLSFDESLELSDGTHMYRSTKFPLYDASGVLYGMCSFSTDTTSLLQTRDALAVTAEKFEAIFNSTFQLIGLLSTDGILLETNKTSLKMIGAKPGDVLGRYFWDTPWWSHSTEYQERLKNGIERAARGESIRFEAVHNDVHGMPNYMDFSITPVKNARGNIIYLLPEGRNITDIKLAQMHQHDSEVRFQTLFSHSKNAMTLLENEIVHKCNASAAEALGYDSPAAVTGQTLQDLSPELQPDGKRSSDKLHAHMQSAYTLGGQRFQWFLKKADGTLLPVDMSLTRIPDNNRRILHVIWFDISAQLQAEKELQTFKEAAFTQESGFDMAQAAENPPVEALDDLRREALRSISRKISTPIGVSVATASYLNSTLTELLQRFRRNELNEDEFGRFLDEAQAASKSMLAHLDKAASYVFSTSALYAEHHADSKQLFNLKKHLDEILMSLHREIEQTPHHISVICPEALNISSYPGIFSQIFTNLIMNSLHHGFRQDHEGHIDIEITLKGPMLFIEYTDDGAGMDQETLSHIFEPFFTTDRLTGSSGLGLHIIHNLVTDKMRGFIHAMSQLGLGVRFSIEIPLD